MLDRACAQNPLKFTDMFRTIKFRWKFDREHPDYFKPDGVFAFVGPQGSGKTLSAVDYTRNLLIKYPKCKLCTNIQIEDFPIVTFEDWLEKNRSRFIDDDGNFIRSDVCLEVDLFNIYKKENRVFPFMDNEDFSKYKNGQFGIIFLIDEIQLYLNSLKSKNINMDVITEISQQRKQRSHIVCTSQVFGRMAKPLREQFSNIVLCKALLFRLLQFNRLIDRDSIEDGGTGTTVVGKVVKRFMWFHSPDRYLIYDTYQKIVRGQFADGKGEDIYDRTGLSSVS